MTETVFTLHRGTAPLLLSLPHVGTAIPEALRPQLVERAMALEDTDWHLERLYAFARELGASLLTPHFSRYVVDLNRPPENAPMYPGVNNTELCPTRLFTGQALYRQIDGVSQAPNPAEVARRVQRYWQPYHAALRAELDRLRAAHGHVMLFDGHSIKSELPWLFDGKLWDLNLGSVDGRSCAPALLEALAQILQGQSRYTHKIDGRFKGGFITRHYGRPSDGVHALQLEMCWSCYMHERPPFDWDDQRAAQVQPLLRQLLRALLDFQPE